MNVVSLTDILLFTQVTDPSKKLGEYEDVSKVEKYDMPEDEYAKRTDSVR